MCILIFPGIRACIRCMDMFVEFEIVLMRMVAVRQADTDLE